MLPLGWPMKLRLPISFRSALFAAIACSQLYNYTLAESQVWPYTGPTSANVVIRPTNPETDAAVEISTWSSCTYVDSITFESGGKYTFTVVGSDNDDGNDYTDLPGYGVFGDGETDITVIGGNSMLSDTSVNIIGFADINKLTIDGGAVLNIAPGIYMNGNQTHDQAGTESGGQFQYSYGVKIKEIELGNGTLMLDNGSGYLYDNNGMPFDSGESLAADAIGYSVTLTDHNARFQIGGNARTEWQVINGESNGEFHDLTIGGKAYAFEVGELRGIRHLTLEGGNFHFSQSSAAIHGWLFIGGQSNLLLESDNIMAQDSGLLSISGSLDIGTTTQTLYAEHALSLKGGVIKASVGDDGSVGSLVFSHEDAVISYVGSRNQIGAAINDGTSLNFGANALHFFGGNYSRASSQSSLNSVGNTANVLTVSGPLIGEGDLIFEGDGKVELTCASLDFSGNVFVRGAAVLIASHQEALINAASVTVESGASLGTSMDGESLTLRGDVYLNDGAILHFDTLQSAISIEQQEGAWVSVIDPDKAGIITSGKFTAGASLTLSLDERPDAVNTYVLLKGTEASSFSGSLTLLIGGREINAGHYSYEVKGYGENAALILYTQMGDVWTGQAGNVWSAADSSTHASWTNNSYSDENAAIFNLTHYHNGLDAPDGKVVISGKVSPLGGIYLFTDPGETYEFTARDAESGIENTFIVKRGSDSAVFKGVSATGMDSVRVEAGTLNLKDKATIEYVGDIIAEVSGSIQLDGASEIMNEDGTAGLVNMEGETATLQGIHLTGTRLSGTEGNEGYVNNAVIRGYELESVSLAGNGELHDVQIADGVEISGGSYKLFGMLTFNSTLVNSGAISFDENAVINIGSLKPGSGTDSSYTLISGGKIEGWQNMSLERFCYHGVALNALKQTPGLNVTTDGELTLTLNGIAPIIWDADWGIDKVPVFGAVYGGSVQYLHHPHDQLGSLYLYSNIVEGGQEDCTVMVVSKGAGQTSGSSAMAGEWRGASTTEEKPVDHWILDEGANYQIKAAGAFELANNGYHYYGDSHLYINGSCDRTDVEVYGGSYNVAQTGDAYLTIEAGTYDVISGASCNADLTGNVHLHLKGGAINAGASYETITSVLAAGKDGAVDGHADVYLGSGFRFVDSDGNNSPLACIDGSDVSGVSILHFTDGVRYDHLSGMNAVIAIESVNGSANYDYPDGYDGFHGYYTTIEIKGFDRIELAEGAHVAIQSCRFNVDKDITISGHGTVQLVDPRIIPNSMGVPSPFDEKESEQWHALYTPDRDIIVTNRATLHVSTRYVTAWNASPANRDWILVADTGTLDMTGWMAGSISSSFLMNVALEGDGSEGRGALYKGVSVDDVDTSGIPQFPTIKLTGNASIGIESGAMPLYLRGANNVYNNTADGTTTDDYLGDYDMSYLNLCDDESGKHYTLTLVGGGILGLDNTTIDGGTINVVSGTLRTINSPDFRGTHHVTSGRTTDLVLSPTGSLYTDLNNGATDLSAALQGGVQTLQMASLSGEGGVDLSDFGINNLELLVEKSTFYDEFMDSDNSYWNSSGYGYAVYSGDIVGDGDSTVSKSGTGVQYFTGSNSDYGYAMDDTRYGGTYISAGTLYCIGTSDFDASTADAFVRGITRVDNGVIGAGDVHWTGYTYNGITNEGRLYLSDGVRILNSGSYFVNTGAGADAGLPRNMIIGVEAQANGSALDSVLYQETRTINRVKCVLIDTTRDNILSVGGFYADGTVYQAGSIIDSTKGGVYVACALLESTPGLSAQTCTYSFNGTECTLIDTHNLSSLSVNGFYLDGTLYKAGDPIDRNKQLYVATADIAGATVNGLNLSGYNEAAWSGGLSDGDGGASNLVKEAGGTLTLDQETSFSGYTLVKGGTLNLRGWATLGTTTAGMVTMEKGTSLKLSYDATYTTAGYDVALEVMKTGTVNETEEMSNDMTLTGRGDARWLNAGEGTDSESAALISDVGAAVTFSLSGELTGDGNVLHSGEGKTIISNTNSYTLGTTVTRGTVEVQTATGLGTTAEGGHAMLDTRSGSLVQFTGDGATTVLAADCHGIGSDGVAFEGNSIEGKIELGTVSGNDTTLAMRGNGYWAEDTRLMNEESSLVFSGEAATNVANGDGNGAGVIHGSGMLAVSDVDASLDHAEHHHLEVQFAAMDNFSGNITVEGTEAVLRVTDSVNASSGNVLTGNNIHISGEGATLDLASDGNTRVEIASGKELAFTSTGAMKDAASAVLKSNAVVVTGGGTLSVAHDNTHFEFADLETMEKETAFSLTEEVMPTYESKVYAHASYGDTIGQTVSRYDYHYDENIGLNQTAVATIQTSDLTLEAGSSYVEKDGHVSVGNGILTLDASHGLIRLDAVVNNQDSLIDGARRQLVLFSDVAGISFSGYEVGYGTVEAGRIESGEDMVYAFAAKDFFYEDEMKNPHVIDPAYTVLVYDAGAGIVYLDTVPEPSGTMLSVLMLTALAARRRRK